MAESRNSDLVPIITLNFSDTQPSLSQNNSSIKKILIKFLSKKYMVHLIGLTEKISYEEFCAKLENALGVPSTQYICIIDCGKMMVSTEEILNLANEESVVCILNDKKLGNNKQQIKLLDSASQNKVFRKHLKVKRVIDYLDKDTSSEQRKKILNFFDKSMSYVVIFLEYQDSMVSGDTEKIDKIKQEIGLLFFESFNAYADKIRQGSHYSLSKNYYENYLSALKKEFEMKKETINLREAFEIFLFKLSILKDQAYGSDLVIPTSPNKEKILSLALDDASTFEKIKKQFSYLSSEYNLQGSVDMVLPLFSNNGVMGFNTILCIVSNEYLPIGFGVDSYPVHANMCFKQSADTTIHDYNHAIGRVMFLKWENLAVFEQYIKTYHDIFVRREKGIKGEIGGINQKTFLENLLFLFFLIFEIAYSNKNYKNERISVEDIIYKRTLLLSELNLDYKELSTEEVTSITILEMIDFIEPLNMLGYKISYNKEKPYESAGAIRSAFMAMKANFSYCYPMIDLGSVIRLTAAEESDLPHPSTTASKHIPVQTTVYGNQGLFTRNGADTEEIQDESKSNQLGFF